jgi:NAD dependent epimerase/dehydratase family enzyme
MLGDGAMVLTEGQRVLPERTLATGYAYKHTTIDEALRALLSS